MLFSSVSKKVEKGLMSYGNDTLSIMLIFASIVIAGIALFNDDIVVKAAVAAYIFLP